MTHPPSTPSHASSPAATAFDCTDVRAVLSALVDGEADALTRHAAERHLVHCATCRRALTDAERVSSLLGVDAAMLAGTDSVAGALPDDFMNAVLGETVHLSRRRRTQWLVNSTGWLAAAACLMLSLVLWNLDRSRSSGGGTGDVATRLQPRGEAPTLGMPYRASLVSEISHEPLSPDAFGLVASREEKSAAANLAQPVNGGVEEDASAVPAGAFALYGTINRDDSETLSAAGRVFDLLDRAEAGSFADVERIRRTVEYDGLLERLAEARARLGEVDQPIVLAAEGLLMRLTRGPLNADDLRELRSLSSRLGMARGLHALGDRWQPSQSL